MERYFWHDNLATIRGHNLRFRITGSFAGSPSGVIQADDHTIGQILSVRNVREISRKEFEVGHPIETTPITVPEENPPKTTINRKEIAMKETSKAMRRRWCENETGEVPWKKILFGDGIDVGCGDDPIQIPGCRGFDIYDGDANYLSRYIAPGTLDYVHASQCLEHMIDPRSALLDWATCVKPGGHIVVTIPDFDIYEKCQWPSRFNPDHKSAWSQWRRSDSRCPVLIHIPTFIEDMERHGLKCIRLKFCDTNFDYSLPASVDQTLPEDGAECFHEIVFQKL